MTSEVLKQDESKAETFSFTWNGGFSYLTYLKKTTNATLTESTIHLESQNRVLGVYPTSPKTVHLPLDQVVGISLRTRVNWFDLIYAIGFSVLTLLTMKWVFTIGAALFLLCSFHLNIILTNRLGNSVLIPTSSKEEADRFIEAVVHNADLVCTSPLVVSRKDIRKMLLGFSAAIVVIVLALVLVGKSNESVFVEWVKESKVLGTTANMEEVLENKKYFRDVKWSKVTRNGIEEDINKYVMYQATYSDQGVSVTIRTIFQVFAPGQFTPVEFSVDGEPHELSEWTMFLVDQANKKEQNSNPSSSNQNVSDPILAEPKVSNEPVQQSTSQPPVSKTIESGITLKNFLVWAQPDPDKQLPVTFDGEKASILVGNDTPNGIKLRVILDSIQTAWSLPLPSDKNGAFDEAGDLKSGFSLYLKDHDFDGDGTPEVVVAASNQLDQTYVWVFGYNFVASENGESPLDLMLSAEGQSDLNISNNKIILPFGSQGLFEEYEYSKGAFHKN